jgi:hypothetical protein
VLGALAAVVGSWWVGKGGRSAVVCDRSLLFSCSVLSDISYSIVYAEMKVHVHVLNLEDVLFVLSMFALPRPFVTAPRQHHVTDLLQAC